MQTHSRDEGWRADTMLEMSGAFLLLRLLKKLKIDSWSELKLGRWDYIEELKFRLYQKTWLMTWKNLRLYWKIWVLKLKKWFLMDFNLQNKEKD